MAHLNREQVEIKPAVTLEYTEEDLGNVEKIKLESEHSKIKLRNNELKREQKDEYNNKNKSGFKVGYSKIEKDIIEDGFYLDSIKLEIDEWSTPNEEEKKTESNLETVQGDIKDKNTRHQNGTKYNCTKCDYKASNNHHLVSHVQSVHENIQYNCNQCEYKAQRMHTLRKHIKNVHEVKYQCKLYGMAWYGTQCDYQAKQKQNLQKHVEIVHDRVKYQCPKCSMKLSSKHNLVQHVKDVHGELRYECTQCDNLYKSKGSLDQHVRSIHKGVEYSCLQCDFKTRYKGSFTVHVATEHEGRSRTRYKCEECDFTTYGKYKVAEHKEAKHDYNLNPCNQCGYKAKTKMKLRNHVKKHH